MERTNYILSDAELRDLPDGTPCTEGGTIADFMDELAEAKRAIIETGAKPQEKRARLLLLMWAVYFLGVLRGGEEYRNTLLAKEPATEQPDFTPLTFELSGSCAQMIADDLDGLMPGELTQLWADLEF